MQSKNGHLNFANNPCRDQHAHGRHSVDVSPQATPGSDLRDPLKSNHGEVGQLLQSPPGVPLGWHETTDQLLPLPFKLDRKDSGCCRLLQCPLKDIEAPLAILTF